MRIVANQWPEDRYLFLFAFDMNSTMERKNPLAAIAAFRQAFRTDERVGLVIKVSRGDADLRGLASLRAECEPGRVWPAWITGVAPARYALSTTSAAPWTCQPS